MKDSFIFHFENIEDMEDLTLEQKGMIFEAMIGYSISGNEPNFTDPELRGAWRPIRRRLKKDMEAYEERCSRNRSNGTKGGRPKENHTVILETQKNPKNPIQIQILIQILILILLQILLLLRILRVSKILSV